MALAQENPGSTDPNEMDMSIVPDVITDPHKIAKPGGAPKDRDKAGRARHGWYSHAKKMQVACAFAVTGNARRTAEICKIPEGTIRAWKTTEWWHEIQDRIKQEQNEELDSKLTKAIDKAMDQINDRLDNGDWIYDSKRGEFLRKPTNLKDIAFVTTLAIDKRQLLRGEPTSRVARVSQNEHLMKLAEQFENFTKAVEINSVAEEIEEELLEEEVIETEEVEEYNEDDEKEEQETLTVNEMFRE